MSARRILGLVLVVVGLIALLWGGISWTHQETVLDAGPIEIKADERERIPLPPALGAVSLIAGVLLLVLPDRRRV